MGKKPAQKSTEKAKKKIKPKSKKPKKVGVKVVKVKSPETEPQEPCKIKDCKREYRAKGYCKAHYRKWRQGEYGVARYKTCHSTDCRKPMTLNRHGLCEEHFQKYYVKGESAPAAVPSTPTKSADKVAEAS